MAISRHFILAPAHLAISAILLVALAGQAMAARPDSRTMTCAQARGLIAQYGSVVMTTGQYTYDRIVHNRGFCGPSQETRLKVVPTYDDPRCRVGYICEERQIFHN